MGLKVAHVTKRFAEKVAVNDISFEMEKPGIFGLLGTNGAGKTTTTFCRGVLVCQHVQCYEKRFRKDYLERKRGS